MEKKKFKNKFVAVHKFEEAGIVKEDEVIIGADEIAEGEEVIVIDDKMEVIEDWTGEVVIEDEEVKIEDGKIVEVVPVEAEKFKNKFVAKRKFEEAGVVKEDEVIIGADEIKEGEEVIVIDDTMKPIEDWTGEVVIEDEEVKIEDGKIVEVVPVDEKPAEMTDHEDEDEEAKKKALAEEEEEKKKKEKLADHENGAGLEEKIMSILQPKLDEMYGVIADLKASMEEAPEEFSEVELSAVEQTAINLNKMTAFLKK